VKGEALYQKGDFELALVCYYRAKRLRPAVPEYDKAIQKARSVIEEHVGGIHTHCTHSYARTHARTILSSNATSNEMLGSSNITGTTHA